MAESSYEEQLQTALDQQRDAWLDNSVDEETRLQRIEQASERIQAIMTGHDESAISPTSVAKPLLPQEKLQNLITLEQEARRRGDKAMVQQLLEEIIELNATLNSAQPPESE